MEPINKKILKGNAIERERKLYPNCQWLSIFFRHSRLQSTKSVLHWLRWKVWCHKVFKIPVFFFMFSKRILTNDSQNFFLSFNYFILWCFIQNRRLMDYLSKHKLVIIWNQWIFKPFFKVLTWKIDLSSKVLVIIHTFKKKILKEQ